MLSSDMENNSLFSASGNASRAVGISVTRPRSLRELRDALVQVAGMVDRDEGD